MYSNRVSPATVPKCPLPLSSSHSRPFPLLTRLPSPVSPSSSHSAPSPPSGPVPFPSLSLLCPLTSPLRLHFPFLTPSSLQDSPAMQSTHALIALLSLTSLPAPAIPGAGSPPDPSQPRNCPHYWPLVTVHYPVLLRSPLRACPEPVEACPELAEGGISSSFRARSPAQAVPYRHP